jgi:hypothetical protein
MTRVVGARRRAAGLAALGLLLAACGGEGETPSGPGLDVSGRYDGTQRFATPAGAGDQALRVTVVQVGSLVNGSFSTGTADAGSVTGSVDGTVFTFRTTSTVFRTTCDFQAGISAAGATLSGTFQCSSGESGTFTLSRA